MGPALLTCEGMGVIALDCAFGHSVIVMPGRLTGCLHVITH